MTHGLRHSPLPPRRIFYRRVLRNTSLAMALITASLFVGMLGYRGFEGMSWLDAFLNASMILSGMGPASPIQTPGGKIFAGCYAIFSGVVFISMAAVLAAPILHRFLHRLHLEMTPEEQSGQTK